jgi:uncharacterized repeat protein (TIGR01451 family)
MPDKTLNGILMGLTPVDLASPGLPGESFTCDGVNLTIIGGGTDIWDTYDQCHFAYRTQSGNFDARVRVVSLTQANVWSKAGIMVRENVFGGDRNVMLCTTPLPLNNVYHTQWRELADNASASCPTISPVSYPDAWIRMVREGNSFSTFIKTNGTDWTWTYTYNAASSYPIDLLLGLAVTAHDNALTATGKFSAFSVTAPKTDLVVSNSANAGVVAQGGTITYTVIVRNAGATATGVVVTDVLPAGVTYSGSSTLTGSAVHSAGTVTWTVGSLAPGASATLTITAVANTTGAKVSTATATSTGQEEVTANNSATVTVQVPLPPIITDPVYAGGHFGFSVATSTGVNYRVEYTDSLSDPDWVTLTTFTGDGTVKPVVDPTPNPNQRFYRTLILSTP